MVFEVILAFLSTITVAVMFNTPKKELLYCGIVGGVGWFFYSLCINNGFCSCFSNFCGSFFIALFSRIFSKVRKNPISIFIIAGIVTLVPGANIYNTILNVVLSNHDKATFYGMETIKSACAIALAIIIIFSMPDFIFNFKINNNKK